jgi:hypothetical protein
VLHPNVWLQQKIQQAEALLRCWKQMEISKAISQNM